MSECNPEAEIQNANRELKKLYLSLCGCGQSIMERIHALISDLEPIARDLKGLGFAWSRAAGERLLLGIKDSRIRRVDRESKILLSLPNGQVNDLYTKWANEVGLADSNSEALASACHYALAKLRTLDSVARETATEISNEGDEGKAFSVRLLALNLQDKGDFRISN